MLLPSAEGHGVRTVREKGRNQGRNQKGQGRNQTGAVLRLDGSRGRIGRRVGANPPALQRARKRGIATPPFARVANATQNEKHGRTVSRYD